jgi:hypothetical protein
MLKGELVGVFMSLFSNVHMYKILCQERGREATLEHRGQPYDRIKTMGICSKNNKLQAKFS